MLEHTFYVIFAQNMKWHYWNCTFALQSQPLFCETSQFQYIRENNISVSHSWSRSIKSITVSDGQKIFQKYCRILYREDLILI